MQVSGRGFIGFLDSGPGIKSFLPSPSLWSDDAAQRGLPGTGDFVNLDSHLHQTKRLKARAHTHTPTRTLDQVVSCEVLKRGRAC